MFFIQCRMCFRCGGDNAKAHNDISNIIARSHDIGCSDRGTFLHCITTETTKIYWLVFDLVPPIKCLVLKPCIQGIWEG